MLNFNFPLQRRRSKITKMLDSPELVGKTVRIADLVAVQRPDMINPESGKRITWTINKRTLNGVTLYSDNTEEFPNIESPYNQVISAFEKISKKYQEESAQLQGKSAEELALLRKEAFPGGNYYTYFSQEKLAQEFALAKETLSA